MAGRGRGRGRGVPTQQKESLPTVGGEPPADLIGPLRTAIKSLSIEVDEQELMVTTGLAKRIATKKEIIELIVDLIYQRCYDDWRFARCAARVCNDLDGLQAEDTKLRDVVLRNIQRDYKSRLELRSGDNKKFLGCVAFLCQVFGVMRVGNGEPFIPLVNPVLDVLSICLAKDSTEEETICGSTQIFVVGKMLQDVADKMKIHQLKNVVRDKVLDDVGSRDTRFMLIDIVEGFASNWRLHSRSNYKNS